MSVLPRATRINESGIDASIFDPLLDLLRDELGAVVALDRGRFSVQLDELIEDANNIERREMTRALDPKRTPSELINDRQESKRLSVARLIRDEVVAPDVVRILSLMRIDRAGSRPATLHGLLRHSQTFSTTKQTDLFASDTPSRGL